MKSRAYRAVDVNRIDVTRLLQERGEVVVHVGLDVGKESILGTLRWGVDEFERPWRVRNPPVSMIGIFNRCRSERANSKK